MTFDKQWKARRTSIESNRSVDHGGWRCLDPPYNIGRVRVCFDPPPLNVTLFHSKLLLFNCNFHIIKDERLMSTTSLADAVKPARRVQRSVKVSKHRTIPYVRYSFLLVWNSNFVFKMRRISDIRLQKWRDLEIRVRGHSRSLKMVPFYRFGMISY